MEKKEKDKKIATDKEDLINSGVAGGAYETIQRYGDANKQYIVAYEGVDNEAGKKLAKGLKKIAQGKINPDYEFNNIHQQAGFAAEVKEVARSNAENIIKGNPNRKVRADDLGQVNDPLYDIVTLDENGNIIKGEKAQMKFLGASQKDPSGKEDSLRAFKKLKNNKKFDKYFENDVKIEVPSDQYEKILQEADKEIDALSNQIEKLKEKQNNSEKLEKLQSKLDRVKKIKKNLRKSKLTKREAIIARKYPEISTIIDVAKISHGAGINTAKMSSIIGGSVSIAQNFVNVYKGEIEIDEAAKNIAKDTARTGLVGYTAGFAGSALKGLMQNAKSGGIRALAKTGTPGSLVSLTFSTTKTLNRYFVGEIDELECLEILGEQGTSMASSAMFTVIGQVAIPIPVIGGMIGSIIGYTISSSAYGILTQSLKDAKIAHEKRLQIEAMCEENIKLIQEYRLQMQNVINIYLSDSMNIFNESFYNIKLYLEIGDVDRFIESANKITEQFNGNIPFSNMQEFNDKMYAKDTFKI